MNIPDWITEALKNIPKLEPKKFIQDLLDLGEITPYNGKYSKLVELTYKYDQEFCNGEFKAKDFFCYFKDAASALYQVDLLLEEGCLEAAQYILECINSKAEVFYDEDTLELATPEDLDDLRTGIIEKVIECESVGGESETN